MEKRIFSPWEIGTILTNWPQIYQITLQKECSYELLLKYTKCTVNFVRKGLAPYFKGYQLSIIVAFQYLAVQAYSKLELTNNYASLGWEEELPSIEVFAIMEGSFIRQTVKLQAILIEISILQPILQLKIVDRDERQISTR